MTPTVYAILKALCDGKQPGDRVFTRDDGSPVLSFRKTWGRVTAAAGVPDLLFHDLRRTGARNMRDLGIPEGVIMQIAGWKTRSVFNRYAMVSRSDLDYYAENGRAREATS